MISYVVRIQSGFSKVSRDIVVAQNKKRHPEWEAPFVCSRRSDLLLHLVSIRADRALEQFENATVLVSP